MVRLGRRIEAARRFTYDKSPYVTWTPSLHKLGKLQRSRGRYDLVVASYVLTEVTNPAERQRLVRKLWGESCWNL